MTATTGDFVAPGSCSDEDEDEETTGPPSFARQLGYEEGDDVLVDKHLYIRAGLPGMVDGLIGENEKKKLLPDALRCNV